MSEPSKHTVFSAADIERYHNGSMNSMERYALEKAALDDPFLADALEGYTYTATPQQDLTKIKKRIRNKTNRKNVFLLFARPSVFFKAAAILLVVAGGGWLVYTTMRPPQTGVANNTDRTTVPKFPRSTADSNQSITYKNPTDIGDNNTDSAPAIINPSRSPSDQPAIAETGKVNSRRPAYATSTHTRNKDEQALGKAEKAAAKEGAAIAATPPQAYPATANQSFISAKEDSTAVASQSQLSRDTLKLNIVLKEDKASLSEVVVVNKGLKRKAAVKPTVSVEESEPADGWDSFSDYIADRLKEPELKEKYSGEVELSFEVNQKGEPVNIVVTKSQCDRCDEEAIRLLKEGPKWKKKARKGKVTIHF